MNCNKHMVQCICEDADERINNLVEYPNLGPNMINNIQTERAENFLAKHDEKKPEDGDSE